MSAPLLLAIAFAVIIAVGSVAVLVNDAVEGWLQRGNERVAAGGGGAGTFVERSRMSGVRASGAGVVRPPTPAVRTRPYGRVLERRSAAGRSRRRPGELR